MTATETCRLCHPAKPVPDRALVVCATNLLLGGFEASSDPAAALGAATGALRRALAFRDPAVAVALVDADPAFGDLPASVRDQHDRLPGLLETHGFTVVPADDPVPLAASYVHAAREAGFDAMVVATDKRLAQLVAGDVWWNDPYKRVRYTPELVRKRFEVGPDAVAGWLALVGDRATLGGVKGLGKKGATDLCAAFGSIEAAVERADEAEGRAGKALRASLDDARLQLDRATLKRDLPLPVPWSELAWTAPAVEDLNALYRDLGFHHLLADEGPAVATTLADSPDAVAALLASLDAALPVAVLAVTEDPAPARGALVGLALAQGDVRAYVPVAQLDTLRPWLEDAAVLKTGHATKSVVVALDRLGVTFAGIAGDSESESHLVDPTGLAPHDLDDLARRVLQRPVEPVDTVRGVGKRRRAWGALKPARVAQHIGPWAAAAFDLHERFAPRVDPAQLDEYLALGAVLARMERNGIACDADDLAASAADFSRIEEETAAGIHALAGREFNVGSTKQLGSVLYEDLGLPVTKRTKTGWSTATAALERIEHAHPIVPLVMKWRLVRWLRGTWAEALTAAIDDDGRIRATFHHARSFSGRIICSHPDLGRVPGRTPEMIRIRHAFYAPPGKVLLSVDYDQLGLYVLAHLSGDPELVRALEAGDDLHTITAAAVLQVPRDEVDAERRQIGKVTNFATFAGQGASALALQLGVDAAEAKDVIARFYAHYAGVDAFQQGEERQARELGYVETIGGRRQLVSGFDSRDSALRSYAERVGRRATHEGSVADVTRRALLHSERAIRDAGLGGFPLHQLLDEVLFEGPEEEVEATTKLVADAMRSVYALRVPLRVAAKAGARWGHLEEIPIPG